MVLLLRDTIVRDAISRDPFAQYGGTVVLNLATVGTQCFVGIWGGNIGR